MTDDYVSSLDLQSNSLVLISAVVVLRFENRRSEWNLFFKEY